MSVLFNLKPFLCNNVSLWPKSTQKNEALLWTPVRCHFSSLRCVVSRQLRNPPHRSAALGKYLRSGLSPQSQRDAPPCSINLSPFFSMCRLMAAKVTLAHSHQLWLLLSLMQSRNIRGSTNSSTLGFKETTFDLSPWRWNGRARLEVSHTHDVDLCFEYSQFCTAIWTLICRRIWPIVSKVECSQWVMVWTLILYFITEPTDWSDLHSIRNLGSRQEAWCLI